jgi:general secretion pathway protein M
MKLNVKADRPTIVVGCSLGLIALFALYWVLHFWILRQDFVGEMEAIQPRTARLLGIMASFDQLEVASNEVSGVLRKLAYPASRDSATTAAAMQQNIRELMTGAGLSISGSQILPARGVDGLDRLSLDITAEGSVDALDEAFSSLGLMRPLVFVKSVTVKPLRIRSPGRSRETESTAGGDPRKLTARFQLFSLRLMD